MAKKPPAIAGNLTILATSNNNTHSLPPLPLPPAGWGIKLETMHHKIIKSLIAEIRLLRQQISSVEQDEYEYRNSDFYERKCRFLKEENDRLLRQAEDERRERESREWERENLMKEFERRQSRGDEWGAERTMRKLKAL